MPQDPGISVQVAATTASLSFYAPDEVLSAARQARAEAQMMADEADEGDEDARGGASRFGIVDVDVDVWSDQDEWGVSLLGVSALGVLANQPNAGLEEGRRSHITH